MVGGIAQSCGAEALMNFEVVSWKNLKEHCCRLRTRRSLGKANFWCLQLSNSVWLKFLLYFILFCYLKGVYGCRHVNQLL